jgi:sec-independent protein translocase protein TatB
MKSQFEGAARDVEQTVNREVNDAQRAFGSQIDDLNASLAGGESSTSSTPSVWEPPPPQYKRPDKHWRLKCSALPRWYKQRSGVRGHVQSGAARVARFRPSGLK